MTAKRKSRSAAFKAQVALAAVEGDKTVDELAAQFGIHPTLIHGVEEATPGRSRGRVR